MKRIFLILVAIMLALSLAVPGFASAPADNPQAGEGNTLPDSIVENSGYSVSPDDVLVGVEVYSLSPVGPEDATGLKAIMLELLGSYDAIVVEYEYRNQNNTYNSYLREVQPDYVWLCSAAIFLVLIYCVFRAGGALLSKT